MGSPTIAALFAQRVVVGVGDLGVSNNPSITLSTYGLGSCVAVVAFDPMMKVGGLLHIMLPDSTISPAKAASQPAMFADTGLPMLFRSLEGLKAQKHRLQLALAGGSSVLCASDNFKIGERNIAAVTRFLAKQGFTVRHASLAGTTNRTVHLEVGTGGVKMKSPSGDQVWTLAD